MMLGTIQQYAMFVFHLMKDSLMYGSLIGVVAYFIAHNRGMEIEPLEAILCVDGLIFCIFVLQFLLHTKNELYNMMSNYSDDDDEGDNY